MNRRDAVISAGIVIAAAAGVVLVRSVPDTHDEAEHDHGHGDAHEEEAPRGPHGGRWLTADDEFSVEMTIYEPGIPPQSRVYPFQGGKPIDPTDVELTVELHRFDRVDLLTYTKRSDFLLGDKVVDEPHSFDVVVRARRGGKSYEWKYASHEGRVAIERETATASGIVVETATPRKMIVRLPVLGQVGMNQEAVKHVTPRYTGVVRDLKKRIGDWVKAGETLAVVESNESLQAFEVRAALGGRVVEKHATLGEVVEAGSTIFVVADLTTVWVDFVVYRDDMATVRPGQKVEIRLDDEVITGQISYIAAVGHSPSQSVVARAVVKNNEGLIKPGLFVSGEIFVEEVAAQVAVKASALQTFRDWQVVFRARDNVYQAALVETGVRDGDWVEVRSGLRPGDAYVSANSFVVKAEIGKAGATHDH